MAKRKSVRTFEGVRLNVYSNVDLVKKDLCGVLTAAVVKDGEVTTANFEEVKGDKALVIVGERKWIPIKVNKQFGIRVTKNKETGEYRILCTLSKEKLQGMTMRDVGELEAELGLMIERIRL